MTAFPLVGLLELRLVLFLHVFTTYIKTQISVQLTLSAKPRNWKACAAQTLGSSQALFTLVSAPDLSNRTLTPGSKLLRYAHQTLATAENETCTVHFPRWILSAGESVL